MSAISTLCTSILYVLVFGCFSINDNSKKRIYAAYADRIFYPSWAASTWNDTSCIVIDGDKEKSENRMYVYAVWTRDSLSFCFKVMDKDLRAYQKEQDHAALFLDDMVEVLMDTKKNKDSCWGDDDIVYHVNLLGVKKDDRGTPGCTTDPSWNGRAGFQVKIHGTLNDTTDIDTGYLVYISFSWAEIGQTPHPGLIMGVNFANGDNDGKGRQLFDWTGASPMRSPYAFGDIILK